MITKKKIAPYRNRLAAIVNRIKHNHARYCYVEGKTSFGNIKGYYIEGMNENGVIVPDLEIHPEFEGRYTAISYNRDIKNYLVDFYILSSIMAKTLWKLIQQASGISLTLNPVSYEKDEEIILLCEDIQGLPNLFFSDEYYTDLPQIIVNKQNQIIEFRKPVYKSFTKSLVRIKSYRFSTLFTTDGISVSWSLPYLGKENL